MKKLKNRKGFTIIELVVVIAILGILGLCAISSYGDVREKAE
ncbi:MAG: prepilin-type N-terminal cleavage/methylation domain-containing protein, partial [Mollicutes bacterium]|nr:prepilin-type N-terminal cleavage/methylation domain-containing protein [Mollicutes bacterium]